MTAQTITAEMIPQTLNGHAVKAFGITKNADRALVLVHRADHRHQPWVVASWWPELGTAWQWGHYFESDAEAHGFLNMRVNETFRA